MSTLWLVATPIGNLGDLAPRAVEVLGSVRAVCCEDTRRTGRLLQHAGVRAERLIVCNEHTEYAQRAEVLDELARGDVAVVSDAGSPGISDPGTRLVAAAIEAGHVVSAVPGPTAATMALTISGLPTGRHVVEGFLPRKGAERRARLTEIAA
ncbi:MAG: ribosomal RNA small subunit methyltransferase I, partial [Actinomycetota bacterium]